MAEFRSQAEVFGVGERAAETSTGVVDGVPFALSVGSTTVVVLVAVLAELLAFPAEVLGRGGMLKCSGCKAVLLK